MEHRKRQQHSPTDEKISNYCRVDVMADFEDRHLRDVVVEHKGFLEPEIDALRDHQPERVESGTYKCVAKLLTKAGLLLCENGMLAKFFCETILTSIPRI